MKLKKHLFIIVILFSYLFTQTKEEVILFCNEISDFYGVPRELLPAIIAVESSFRQHIISPKGAHGLMQVMPSAHSDYLRLCSNPKVTNYQMVIDNWDDNIRVGSWYLFVFLRQIKKLDYKEMITAYFWGSDNLGVKSTDQYYNDVREKKNVSRTN